MAIGSIYTPWRDRAGRFSALKAATLALAVLPAAWLATEACEGWLAPEPWTEALHQSGIWAVRFLLLALAVTPLRRVWQWGQLIAVRAGAYALAGGHAGIRTSLHDGLTLPRLFRAAGLRTDLVAGAGLAPCRMYAGWRAVLRGTTKNATEGMAQPVALPIWTALLIGGHVLPWVLLVIALAAGDGLAALCAAACVGPLVARLAQAVICREPLASVPLHPFAIVLLLALQWLALARRWAGKPETWRGRSYPVRGEPC